MDENRIEGAARKLGGQAQGAAGSLTGDAGLQAEGKAREVAGAAQEGFGAAQERVADGASDEIARIRAQVESLLGDKVTPALANATEAAAGYARDARAAVEGQAENAASAIKGRPLVAVAVVAAVAFLLGRLTATTQVHYHG